MADKTLLIPARDTRYQTEKKKPDIRELTLAHGISFPSDSELLMLILGSGTKNVPIELLAQKALLAIEESDEKDLVRNLTAVTGLGTNRALAIAASLEFGRRRHLYREARIQAPQDILPYVQHYALHRKEHFVCAVLSGAREILGIYVVSMGSANKTLVHPREVFAEAVQRHASAIICCHNHPSGVCHPSSADRETTRRLQVAADYLGIAFLDHIILTQNEYFSFREHGLLEPEPDEIAAAMHG